MHASSTSCSSGVARGVRDSWATCVFGKPTATRLCASIYRTQKGGAAGSGANRSIVTSAKNTMLKDPYFASRLLVLAVFTLLTAFGFALLAFLNGRKARKRSSMLR